MNFLAEISVHWASTLPARHPTQVDQVISKTVSRLTVECTITLLLVAKARSSVDISTIASVLTVLFTLETGRSYKTVTFMYSHNVCAQNPERPLSVTNMFGKKVFMQCEDQQAI